MFRLYEYMPVIPDSGLCHRAAIVESASVILGLDFIEILSRQSAFTCFLYVKPRIMMNIWTDDW